MKKAIQTIFLIVAMFAVLLGGAYLLSKTPWIRAMKRPLGWLWWTGIGGATCGGIRLVMKLECRQTPTVERWQKAFGIIFWLAFCTYGVFRMALEFAGVI